MSYLMNCTDLQAILKNHVKVIDVRGSKAYKKGHIPGAIPFDIKSDFTGETAFFPEVDVLSATLGDAGIDEHMQIVIYDEGINRDAAKAWVVLHYLGHENVEILQGGYAAWVGAQLPVSTEDVTYDEVKYTPNVQVDVAVDLDEMKKKLQHDHTVLIDSRAKERYMGEYEPKYAKAGHIPGAVNYASKDVFTDDGTWHDKEKLKAHFSDIEHAPEVVVSCGTGTSACMNFVALKEAGIDNVRLFPGGFKQWIDEGHDVETD